MPTPQRLSDEDFGQKIYERFPTQYQIDDVGQKLALKRYIQALSDGGFSYVIKDANGILDIVNPASTDISVVYKLYEQYGLNVFHGIPEDYLRALLPFIGTAWQRKGSLDVIEYISSMLSGIKTETVVTYQDDSNSTFGDAVFNQAVFGNTETYSYPVITVRLEMDYSLSDYFPDSAQFRRLLENFVPFYAYLNLVYSYLYTDESSFSVKEMAVDHLTHLVEESQGIKLFGITDKNSSAFNIGKPFGQAVFNNNDFTYPTEYAKDKITSTYTDKNGVISHHVSAMFGEAVMNQTLMGYLPEIDTIKFAVQNEVSKAKGVEVVVDKVAETKEESGNFSLYGIIDKTNSVFGISQPLGVAVFNDDKFKAKTEVEVDKISHVDTDRYKVHPMGSARFTESVFGDYYLGFVPSESKVKTTLLDTFATRATENLVDKVSTMSVKNATFKHAVIGFAFLGNTSFDTETITY